MIKLGTSVRRRSIQRVEPKMPSITTKREPSSNGRTKYHQIDIPSEQLKNFQRKKLYTNTNLSTQKSEGINPEDHFTMNNSRFGYNHHDTNSIAQLLQSKRSSIQASNDKEMANKHSSNDISSIVNQKSSLENQSIEEENNLNDENDQDQKDKDQNYDDYVMGEKIEEEPETINQIKNKKYKHDHMLPIDHYLPKTQSEIRMEMQYIQSQRKNLLKIREDQQIFDHLNLYKINKQKVINQSNRKYQISKFIGHHQPIYKNIQKSSSLPYLKAPKQEFIMPNAQIIDESKKWKNPENLLAQKLDQENTKPGVMLRIKNSLSYAKLGFGVKATRQICSKDIFEEQLKMTEAIKSKLRQKNIPFDANKIKKSLLNLRTEPEYANIESFPTKNLPSNPIYKKFPL